MGPVAVPRAPPYFLPKPTASRLRNLACRLEGAHRDGRFKISRRERDALAALFSLEFPFGSRAKWDKRPTEHLDSDARKWHVGSYRGPVVKVGIVPVTKKSSYVRSQWLNVPVGLLRLLPELDETRDGVVWTVVHRGTGTAVWSARQLSQQGNRRAAETDMFVRSDLGQLDGGVHEARIPTGIAGKWPHLRDSPTYQLVELTRLQRLIGEDPLDAGADGTTGGE
jgi:hypothetical protein